MTEKEFWAKSFFLAQKNYHGSLHSPVVYGEEGEPLVRDKYNFIEYCARYADMCLEEYRSLSESLGEEKRETDLGASARTPLPGCQKS